MTRHRTSSPHLRRLLGLLGTLVLVGMSNLNAQGWEIYFGGINDDMGQDVIQTKDHGYLAVGFSESFTLNYGAYAVRTDVDGTEIWSKAYDDGFIVQAYSVTETNQGGEYLILGDLTDSPVQPFDWDIYMLRIDDKGEKIQSLQFQGTGGNQRGRKIVATENAGGYLIVGSTDGSGNGEDDVYVIKIDEFGNQIWAKPYGTTGDDIGRSAVETLDGYLVIGTAENPGNNSKDIYLLKVDFNGNEQWSKFIGTAEFDEGYDIVATNDGNFAIVGNVNTFEDVFLSKINADGEEIWSTTLGGSLEDNAYDLMETENGDLVLVGQTGISADNSDAFLARYTSEGDEVWFKVVGRSGLLDQATGIAPTVDDGFIVVGSNGPFFNLVNDLTLIRASANGSVYNNLIQGKVIIDLNGACDFTPGEPGLRDWIIRAESADKTFFGTSDTDGAYEITVDTGDYVLSILPKNDYWSSCIGNYNLSFNGQYDTLTRHFPMEVVEVCPLLEVDLSTPVVQNCSNMAYTVSYCNTGTVGEGEPFIHVILDNDLEIVSSPLPFSTMDSLVIFELDSIGLDTCGSFFFIAEADCNGQPNETYFASAHIFPDTICQDTMGSNWDNASVKVDGYCDTDSVRFILSNKGAGDMNNALEFIVIEDHILGLEGPQEFQLQAAMDTTITKVADGTTYRIIAEQSPGHPGSSYPTVAVEGCTTGSTFSTGFTTELQEDENDPFISIDVQEAISSTTDYIFLRGYPKGYLEGGENQIPANTPLEYHIYFENSGTDTIQRLVIRDTLPASLELGTVVPGASSHPYEFEAYSTGVLKFTFEDLSLSPNGGAASTGFVKFKISQKPNNPAGTLIPNSATVFLGFDEPVETATYTHVVGGEIARDFIITDVSEPYLPGIEINAYPNPFTSTIQFEVGGKPFKEITVTVFDMSGQFVRREKVSGNQLQLTRGHLLAGMYTYQLEGDGQLLHTGKIIVR